jgi:1-acyl-sn-glycerol-3-phosphate acyltransferase/nucleoside-diphosphate-sugar epimerase
MARVAVVAARDGVAEPLIRTLRRSPHVECCERVEDDPAFESFDTIVYSALPAHGGSIGPDLESARGVCARLASLPLKQIVVVSSAAVYGADHHNVGLIDETAFIAAGRSEVADGWRQVESLARTIGERTDPVRTVLRPAALLDGADYFSRMLTDAVAITCPGFDPTIQFLSPTDLAAAASAAIERRAEGVYNVAPAGGIPLRQALHVAGVRRLPLPRLMHRAMRSIAAPAGLSVPSDELPYIQYSWTVSDGKIRRELGFNPSRSSERAILELIGNDAGEGGTGEVGREFDAFGMDPSYIARYCGHLFHLLHQYYWRIEVDGLEHVPARGRGVLVGMHRGFMPFDGVMALYALVRRAGRIPRFLIHPSLSKFPFLADFMAKLGGIMACQENADYVLQRDELLGVFPEGIRGAFRPYTRAYTLGKFGRDEFVRMALRNRAPLLPFVTVGSAEIFPIVGRIDWSAFKRYTEWPFLPITVPFPLPSKWHTQFLPPIHVEATYPPEAAEDPDVVRLISLDVRKRMQAAIDDMRSRRRSIFFGALSPRS